MFVVGTVSYLFCSIPGAVSSDECTNKIPMDAKNIMRCTLCGSTDWHTGEQIRIFAVRCSGRVRSVTLRKLSMYAFVKALEMYTQHACAAREHAKKKQKKKKKGK